MKNIVRNKTVRALCLLAVGALLVMQSDRAPAWLVQGIGALLIIPGIVSLLSLLRKDRSQREMLLYPVMGLVTIMAGVALILAPSYFVQAFMYLLAALLIAAGIAQMISRWRMRRTGIPVAWATFLIPLISVAAGIFVIVYRELAAALPFIVLGAAYILYALLELWSAMDVWKFSRTQTRNAQPALEATPAIEPEVVDADFEEVEIVEDTF